MPEDTYETLGPNMRARLDRAELVEHKLRDWTQLLSERGQAHWLLARELCLIMGWPAPRNPK